MGETNNVLTVCDQDFAEQVLQANVPVIVDFTAAWCPPCHALAPVYEKLSQAYTGHVRFARMDVDNNPQTTIQQGIQGMPTLVLYVHGRPTGRLVGPHPARLQQGIDRLLAQVSATI